MSKRFSLEVKLIFTITVVALLFFTAVVGVSVFGEQDKERESTFIVSSQTIYKES